MAPPVLATMGTIRAYVSLVTKGRTANKVKCDFVVNVRSRLSAYFEGSRKKSILTPKTSLVVQIFIRLLFIAVAVTIIIALVHDKDGKVF